MLFQGEHLGLLVGRSGIHAYDLRRREDLGTYQDTVLALAPWKGRRAKVTAVLSDAYCRYAICARPAGLRTPAEVQAAAKSRIRALYGDVEGWPVRVSAAPFASTDFAVAVDAAVLTDIEGCIRASGLRLASVRPHWLAWLRAVQPGLRRGDHWVLAQESEWVGIGYLSQGRCMHVRSVRVEEHPLCVNVLLARERALLPTADFDATVWLMGGEVPNLARLDCGAPFKAMPSTFLWGLG